MNITELNNPSPSPFISPSQNLQALEAKVDKILDYQKGAYHWAVVRGVIDFLIFMVFVIIPIVGSFYLYKYIATEVDFGKLSDQYGQVTKGLNQIDSMNTGGGMPNITDLLNKVSGAAK